MHRAPLVRRIERQWESEISGDTLGHTDISPLSNTVVNSQGTIVGVEWAVDARGCDPKRLRDPALLRSLCDSIVVDLGLNVVGDPLCHQFPEPGGVTTLYLLSESHLACHTYPEHALATFNLYCCRDRDVWPWQQRLREFLGAEDVRVQRLTRGCETTGQIAMKQIATSQVATSQVAKKQHGESR